MNLKCPLCGSHRLKTVDGADGNPYHEKNLEKTVCLDCGMTVSREVSLEELKKATVKIKK